MFIIIVFFSPGVGGWIIGIDWLGSFGNTSTASGGSETAAKAETCWSSEEKRRPDCLNYSSAFCSSRPRSENRDVTQAANLHTLSFLNYWFTIKEIALFLH